MNCALICVFPRKRKHSFKLTTPLSMKQLDGGRQAAGHVTAKQKNPIKPPKLDQRQHPILEPVNSTNVLFENEFSERFFHQVAVTVVTTVLCVSLPALWLIYLGRFFKCLNGSDINLRSGLLQMWLQLVFLGHNLQWKYIFGVCLAPAQTVFFSLLSHKIDYRLWALSWALLVTMATTWSALSADLTF